MKAAPVIRELQLNKLISISLLKRPCNQTLQLPYDGEAKPYRSRLHVSEVMTIVIAYAI